MPGCANHPKAAATWRCPACQKDLCLECIQTLMLRGEQVRRCLTCGMVCNCLVPEGAAERGFFARLPGAFLYPLRGTGWIMLIVGSVLFALVGLTVALLGGGILIPVALIGYLLAAGYLCAFMIKVIRSSGSGDQELPDWPELGGWWEDILRPFLLILATGAFCLAPAVAWLLIAGVPADPASVERWVPLALLARGLLYLPMAMTAVALHNAMAALNPLLVVRSILRIPLQYLVACLTLLAVEALQVALKDVFVERPVLRWAVLGCASFYLLVVEMRILGLMYHANREKLGWF
jgi:hypothetical protein